LYDK